jgi:cytochrome c-type biogenesis protein CcmF
MVVGMVSPETKRASLQIHVNPLVSWIWAGVLVLILGASVSLWPELSEREVGAWAYVRAAAAGLSAIAFAIWLGMSPSTAYASTRSSQGPPAVFAPVGPEPSVPRGAIELSASALAMGGALGVFFARRRRDER